jgi:hypothetical protein
MLPKWHRVRIMQLEVETRPGPYGDPEPVAFLLGPHRLKVLEIIDRWIAHDHSYFKFGASDANIYILRFDDASDTWELTLFQSPRANP